MKTLNEQLVTLGVNVIFEDDGAIISGSPLTRDQLIELKDLAIGEVLDRDKIVVAIDEKLKKVC